MVVGLTVFTLVLLASMSVLAFASRWAPGLILIALALGAWALCLLARDERRDA